MAEKEATVFIVDVGRSMGKTNHGRQQSDLDWSLQYVWDKITNIVYVGRKTTLVGVLGVRTDKTNNHMMEDPGYSNINLLQAIAQILMPDMQKLPTRLKPSNTDNGDVLSAVILAVDMIIKHCKHLKYIKKIILVTNGTGQIDPDDIESTANQIKTNGIQLTVLGVDFDDAEFGFKEEDKSSRKAKNEKLLRQLVELSEGQFGTMQEAIDGLTKPHIKPVRPIPTYKGQLRLGDPNQYDTAITIDIERYFKVSIRRPPTASSFVLKQNNTQGESDDLAGVRTAYKYSIQDGENGRKDVQREELAKGYEYGRTAVHISESDENITKLETEAAYEILGFIPSDNVERYMLIDNTNMLVAQKGNDKAAIALSSLVHALFELGSCAVARFIKKDMAEPQITLLSPHVDEEIECLIENILPFAEDLRQYRFPPIDKIVTVSGKNMTSHRNLPSNDLLTAMSNFVDEMSLMNDEERLPIDDTFSPAFHTIENAIKNRAIHPDEGLPAKPEIVLQPSKQPTDLQEQSKTSLERLMKGADVKKVPAKAKGRRKYREPEKPLSGLNVEALFNKEKKLRISPDNAIPDFKRAMAQPDNDEVIKDAIKQMSVIIEDQIKNSFGDSNYDRAVEGLGVIRSETIEFEVPDLYNDVLRRLKKKILAEELGGNRKELWWKIRISRLGMIDDVQSPASQVTKEEAEEFLSSK